MCVKNNFPFTRRKISLAWIPAMNISAIFSQTAGYVEFTFV
jgi:hypothetical protein